MATGTAVSAPTARERLLAAADELFYDEGIHVVGIDRIIEKAGVAKATLYAAFGSKEGLVRAYLMGRFEARQRRIDETLAALDDPRERVLGVFDALARACAELGFRGCAFLNATAESAPGSAAEEVSDLSREWTRSLFVDLARATGAADPEALSRQLVLLYDGALVSARMDHDCGAIATAKATAGAIVDAATHTSPS